MTERLALSYTFDGGIQTDYTPAHFNTLTPDGRVGELFDVDIWHEMLTVTGRTARVATCLMPSASIHKAPSENFQPLV